MSYAEGNRENEEGVYAYDFGQSAEWPTKKRGRQGREGRTENALWEGGVLLLS